MHCSFGGNCCLFGKLSRHLGTYLLVGLTAVTVLIVMVLNLGVYSGFLTNNFMDINVLICGSNITGIVDVSKSLVYSGLLVGVSIEG